DTMIWNNGDGSDVMAGGKGRDTAVANGSDEAGDAFRMETTEDGVLFERTNFGEFSINIRTTEEMIVRGGGGDDLLDATALEAGSIALRAFGGAGSDTLIGSQGDDELRGAGGADRLVGFRGDDVMIGGKGRDALVWNNGDGSDLMRGQAGFDSVEVNGSDEAGDVFEVRSTDDGALFERVNFGNFALDMRSVERLAVSGGGGDDVLDATGLLADGSKLRAFGGAGNDALAGGEGDDILKGDAGDDLLTGDRGADRMLGGDGDDVMVWNNGDGSDLMDGGAGTDVARANGSDADADVFEISDGANGVDFARTNRGEFTLDIRDAETVEVNGLGGDDGVDATELLCSDVSVVADGGAGNDVLTGGGADDALTGGTGDDRLDGGLGDDLLTGGAGADVFVFSAGDDTVTDFADGEDLIDMSGLLGVDDFADIAGGISQEAAGALISVGGGDLLLEGVTAADLDANDFIFCGGWEDEVQPGRAAPGAAGRFRFRRARNS
ncbi:MAG: calcium-binding protein, partial [Pseudomonadota bacterium]|nr:calcium-binding protein [Pseudomonadota bacterium]